MLKECSPCPAVWIAYAMMALTVLPASDEKFSIDESRLTQMVFPRLMIFGIGSKLILLPPRGGEGWSGVLHY